MYKKISVVLALFIVAGVLYFSTQSRGPIHWDNEEIIVSFPLTERELTTWIAHTSSELGYEIKHPETLEPQLDKIRGLEALNHITDQSILFAVYSLAKQGGSEISGVKDFHKFVERHLKFEAAKMPLRENQLYLLPGYVDGIDVVEVFDIPLFNQARVYLYDANKRVAWVVEGIYYGEEEKEVFRKILGTFEFIK